MKKSGINLSVVAIIWVLGLLSTGCFSISKEKDKEEVEISYDSDSDEEMNINIDSEEDGEVKINIDLKDPVKSLEGLADKLTKGEGEEIEVINFRELKEMLPNRVAGMKLDDSSGKLQEPWALKFPR